LLVVLATGIAMTLTRDDHGVGIAIGITVAGLVKARRMMLSRPTPRRWAQTAVAVSGVVAAAVLTWVAWAHLLGIALVITGTDGHESHVGWLSITLVAAVACLAASLALRILARRSPAHGVHIWIGLCLGTALISVIGPLTLAVGTASMAALISLHLVCATATLALLAPPAVASDPRPNARRRTPPTRTAGPAPADGARRG
jgi:uncharacterized membrane protein